MFNPFNMMSGSKNSPANSPSHGSQASGSTGSATISNVNTMPRGSKNKVANRSSTRSSDLPEELKNMNKLMNDIKVKDAIVSHMYYPYQIST